MIEFCAKIKPIKTKRKPLANKPGQYLRANLWVMIMAGQIDSTSWADLNDIVCKWEHRGSEGVTYPRPCVFYGMFTRSKTRRQGIGSAAQWPLGRCWVVQALAASPRREPGAHIQYQRSGPWDTAISSMMTREMSVVTTASWSLFGYPHMSHEGCVGFHFDSGSQVKCTLFIPIDLMANLVTVGSQIQEIMAITKKEYT